MGRWPVSRRGDAIAFAPPGLTNSTTFADPNNLYLDMTDFTAAVPVPPTNVPMGAIGIMQQTQALNVIDSNYKSPYVQNLTMLTPAGLPQFDLDYHVHRNSGSEAVLDLLAVQFRRRVV